MATGRRPPDANRPEIPDLEVGPSRSARPGAGAGLRPETERPRSATPVAKPEVSKAHPDPADYFGSSSFEADDESALGLDLDTSEAPARSGPGPALGIPGGGGAEPALDLYEGSLYEGSTASAAASVPARVSATPAARKWPTGTSPDAASLTIDPAEVTLLAEYGRAPDNPVLAPVYAVRVLLCRRPLARAARERAAELADAERRRDELLGRMLLELRGRLGESEEGAAILEPVVAAEKLALDRRAALAGESDEFGRRADDLEREVELLRGEAEERAARVDEHAAKAAEAGRCLSRAEAKKKRLYIELRGIIDVSEKAGGALSGDQARRVAELEAEIAAHEPALAAATADASAASAALATARKAVDDVQRKMRDVERRRRALDREFETRIGARSASTAEAEARRAALLADAARQVLAAKGRLAVVSDSILDGIARADAEVATRALELEKYVRAAKSYDPDVLKQGIAVGVGAVLALLAAIGVLATR
jgi:hypothetical protein